MDFFFFFFSTVGKKLLLPQFLPQYFVSSASQNRHSSQQEEDWNSDQFSVLLSSWLYMQTSLQFTEAWSASRSFTAIACHFVLLASFISKADHHVLQQFEFCREIFLYMALFFYFKARYLLLFLPVEGSQYLRPLQIHRACQQGTVLVKHIIFALILNTMKKNILI